ncbi:MAG TPA: hypothetical protein VJS19_04345 [Candidatus Dormibacteraeota bacterium]|nr:hypothetical protein [Candidatus Dormibacteraeota bacterium]
MALRGIVGLLAILLLASCGRMPETVAATSNATVVATDADNGKTVSLHVGDHLDVKLASTYWTIGDSSDPNVLKTAGPPVVSPQTSGCVPGGGCGFAIASFIAVATGSADVTASRTSCGEAMRCTGDSGSFRLTVVVSS